MADKLMAKVREDAKSIRTITVKVRYNDMEEEQASESLAGTQRSRNGNLFNWFPATAKGLATTSQLAPGVAQAFECV